MDSEHRSGRCFFTSMAVVMIAAALVGFAPSFYLRGLVHYPRPNPTLNALVVLHGMMLSLWLLVFYMQTLLIGAGRRDLHMRLGIGGMLLAAAMIPVMYLTTVGGVARGSAPPFATALGWTAVPLAELLAYIPLIALGWRHRRNANAHKRLMLSAGLLLIAPALGRFPIAPPVLAGHAATQILALCLFIPLMIYDRRNLGRLHWATLLGFASAATATLLGLAGVAFPAWSVVASKLPGV